MFQVLMGETPHPSENAGVVEPLDVFFRRTEKRLEQLLDSAENCAAKGDVAGNFFSLPGVPGREFYINIRKIVTKDEEKLPSGDIRG